MKNKYKPPDYNTDVNEGIFDYTHYGNCFFRPHQPQWQSHARHDIITFNPDIHHDELHNNIVISNLVPPTVKNKILQIVQTNWDAFCNEGCRQPILGFEFSIDTGTATPVCKYYILYISFYCITFILFLYQRTHQSSYSSIINMSKYHHFLFQHII